MADRSEKSEGWQGNGVAPELKDSEKRREVILVGGKTGLGKSYLVKNTLLKAFPRRIIADPMGEYSKSLEIDDSADLAGYCMSHKFFSVRNGYVPAFADLSYTAYNIGKCCLIIEESQRYIPSRCNIDPYFEDLVFRGRHRAVSLMPIMQRFSTVHINVRSQWTQIISFRQTETADTTWLRDTSGFELAELESLPPGRYYHITPHSAEIKGNSF